MSAVTERHVRLLAGATSDDVVECLIQTVEEAASRAANYRVAARDADDLSEDVVNEGIAFISRIEDTFSLLPDNARADEAKAELRRANGELIAYGFGGRRCWTYAEDEDAAA